MAEPDRSDIEQAAIEVEVFEREKALVRKAAGVIGDDQLAVMMLNAFIVGNRIVVEGAKHQDDQRGEKNGGSEIMGVETRDPQNRLEPRRRSTSNAGGPRPGKPFLGHGIGYLTPQGLPALRRSAPLPRQYSRFRRPAPVM